jgi:hypothetical protein
MDNPVLNMALEERNMDSQASLACIPEPSADLITGASQEASPPAASRVSAEEGFTAEADFMVGADPTAEAVIVSFLCPNANTSDGETNDKGQRSLIR